MGIQIRIPEVSRINGILVAKIVIVLNHDENQLFIAVFEKSCRGQAILTEVRDGQNNASDLAVIPEEHLHRLKRDAEEAFKKASNPTRVIKVNRETREAVIAYMDIWSSPEIIRYRVIFVPNDKKWVKPIVKEFYDELGRLVDIQANIPDDIYHRMAKRAAAVLFEKRGVSDGDRT